MMRLLASFLLVTTALAGCSDGGGSGEPTGTTPPLQSGKGAIAGLVINDVFRPVPNALVLLQPGGLTATSDASGQFTFTNLEPGAYVLRIQAEGHEAAPTNAEVREGEYAEVEAIARRIVNEGNRIVTTEYSVFVSCNVNAVILGLPADCTGDLSGDTDRAAFTSNYTGVAGITYMVTEMKANKVGAYEVRIRPTDHDQGGSDNFAVMEIKDSDYLRIINKVGEVAHEPYELTGNNAAWNNTEEFITILYVDAATKNVTGQGDFGASVDLGIRAKFVQSVFVGEPEVNIETYCVLC